VAQLHDRQHKEMFRSASAERQRDKGTPPLRSVGGIAWTARIVPG
jgi:hypothetical protein